jgi:hypothetical protein
MDTTHRSDVRSGQARGPANLARRQGLLICCGRAGSRGGARGAFTSSRLSGLLMCPRPQARPTPGMLLRSMPPPGFAAVSYYYDARNETLTNALIRRSFESSPASRCESRIGGVTILTDSIS